MRSTGLSVIIGSWKIIAMRLPRICAQLAPAAASRRSSPFEQDAAADDAARRVDQAEDRVAGHRLAGAGLADQAQHLAAADA